MRTVSRLLWKWWREIWPLLASMMALQIIEGIRSDHPCGGRCSVGTECVSYVLTISPPCLILLFGAECALMAKRDSEERPLIPAAPWAFWLVSFVLPALLSAALGFCGPAYSDTSRGVSAGLEASLFGSCYLLAGTLSSWWAILALVLIPYDGPLSEPAGLTYYTAMCALGAFLLIVGARRKSWQMRRALALAVPVVLIAGLTGVYALREATHGGKIFSSTRISAQDRTLLVWGEDGGSKQNLIFWNLRTGFWTQRAFPPMSAALAFDQRGRVLVAWRYPQEAALRLAWWNAHDNALLNDVSIPYPHSGFGFPVAKVRSDGRYALVSVWPSNGSGRDIWLLNMQKRSARMVAANAAEINLNTAAIAWLPSDEVACRPHQGKQWESVGLDSGVLRRTAIIWENNR